jgi:hypothetical protein
MCVLFFVAEAIEKQSHILKTEAGSFSKIFYLTVEKSIFGGKFVAVISIILSNAVIALLRSTLTYCSS